MPAEASLNYRQSGLAITALRVNYWEREPADDAGEGAMIAEGARLSSNMQKD